MTRVPTERFDVIEDGVGVPRPIVTEEQDAQLLQFGTLAVCTGPDTTKRAEMAVSAGWIRPETTPVSLRPVPTHPWCDQLSVYLKALNVS